MRQTIERVCVFPIVLSVLYSLVVVPESKGSVFVVAIGKPCRQIGGMVEMFPVKIHINLFVTVFYSVVSNAENTFVVVFCGCKHDITQRSMLPLTAKEKRYTKEQADKLFHAAESKCFYLMGEGLSQKFRVLFTFTASVREKGGICRRCAKCKYCSVTLQT